MNDDIVPGLLKRIKQEFEVGVIDSKIIQKAIDELSKGKADFKTVNHYARELGNILSVALQKNITIDTLPNGQLHFNIIDRILNDTLKENFRLINDFSNDVESLLNQKANIHLAVKHPKISQDRIDGLVKKMLEYETFKEAQWLLGPSIVNFSQSVADDFIKTNVDFHAKTGLKPKIRRSVVGKCCDWCEQKAGTYDYPVPNDVYLRHRNCDCLVEYFPGNGRVQNSHTKTWR